MKKISIFALFVIIGYFVGGMFMPDGTNFITQTAVGMLIELAFGAGALIVEKLLKL